MAASGRAHSMMRRRSGYSAPAGGRSTSAQDTFSGSQNLSLQIQAEIKEVIGKKETVERPERSEADELTAQWSLLPAALREHNREVKSQTSGLTCSSWRATPTASLETSLLKACRAHHSSWCVHLRHHVSSC